jgi:hypothetical protein
MSRRLAGDLLMRVPAVGETRPRNAGPVGSPVDEGLQLLQRADVRVEAEPTFTAAHERLGLTLSETRIDTVYNGTLMHLDAISPATQAAFPDLRPDHTTRVQCIRGRQIYATAMLHCTTWSQYKRAPTSAGLLSCLFVARSAFGCLHQLRNRMASHRPLVSGSHQQQPGEAAFGSSVNPLPCAKLNAWVARPLRSI